MFGGKDTNKRKGIQTAKLNIIKKAKFNKNRKYARQKDVRSLQPTSL